jgi:hypothetical protein
MDVKPNQQTHGAHSPASARRHHHTIGGSHYNDEVESDPEIALNTEERERERHRNDCRNDWCGLIRLISRYEAFVKKYPATAELIIVALKLIMQIVIISS